MRERFCRSCREWHDVDNWPDHCRPETKGAPSEHPVPHFITDTMEPVQSMLDGRMYDSKATLRQTYKDAGVVEVGNDSSVTDPKRKPNEKPDRQQIKAAVGKAFSQAGLGA